MLFDQRLLVKLENKINYCQISEISVSKSQHVYGMCR